MGKTTRTILTLGAIGLVAYLLYKNNVILYTAKHNEY